MKTLYVGKCEIPFKNNSHKAIEFNLEFYEKLMFEDDLLMVSLMNNNAPYTINLDCKETKHIQIETEIDLSKCNRSH